MQNVDLNRIDNENQNQRKKKKKVRRFRIWEMTSDPKSFIVLLFLAVFFVTTSFICLSDVVRQRNEMKMEISRLRRDVNNNNNNNDKGKKRKKPSAKEERKKRKIFNTSLRQAIKKEKNL